MKTSGLLPLILLLVLLEAGCQDSDPPLAPVLEPAQAPVMSLLPTWSPGTDLDLAWNTPLKAAARFQVQQATDPDFTVDVQETAWQAATHWLATGLRHNQTYYFRVRARVANFGDSAYSLPVSTTLDSAAPVARLLNLGTDQTSLMFNLDWSVSDDGSGPAETTLWFRAPDGPWAVVGAFREGPVSFTAPVSGRFDFRAVAVDVAGNAQDLDAAPVKQTIVPEPIIIVDMQGEEFDITNAVLRYGIAEAYWGFGLGRNAIQPINNPRFVGPGEPGYLADTSLADVMGVEFGGDARGYQVSDLNDREVVNDVVQGVHLAATY